MHLVSDPSSSQTEIIDLRAALDDFYRKTTVYTAFQETSDRTGFYTEALTLFGSSPRPLSILELGAGRTGLSAFLRKVGREDIKVTAQDVTPANLAYLQHECHSVHIGDVSELPTEAFDLVLHSYVLEHVSAPREFLENVARVLKPGGWHAFLCPRYDVPGYLCPSLRHLSRPGRWAQICRLTASRIVSAIDGRERFLVNCDPAVLHTSWFRDADAVHIVSRLDLERWHRRNGFSTVRRLKPQAAGGLRGAILFKLLTVGLVAQKALPIARQ